MAQTTSKEAMEEEEVLEAAKVKVERKETQAGRLSVCS